MAETASRPRRPRRSGGRPAPAGAPATLPDGGVRLPAPPAAFPTPGEEAAAARAPVPAGEPGHVPHVAIISGLSGAGKTAASKLFEDVGYQVVDNLPPELLPPLAQLIASQPDRFARVAIVLDARAGDPRGALQRVLAELRGRGILPDVFFLEARDDVLIRRFSETRHRHPLQGKQGIAESITEERALLAEVRDAATVVIDTSDLSGRQLRERIAAALEPDPEAGAMTLQLITFGYKHGVPLEADLVFDVRFMENPFYRTELRPHSGLTPAVRTFVLGQPAAQRFLALMSDFFAFAIPAYAAEGKNRLTVAIGCTGGYHRSVAIAERLASEWRERGYGSVNVWHRELERA